MKMNSKIAIVALLTAALSPSLTFATKTTPTKETSILSEAQVDSILEDSMKIHFAPDISHLSQAERKTLDYLVQTGHILHNLYLNAQHKDALQQKAALQELAAKGNKDAEKRLTLYRIFKGPIATTPDNKRVPFVAADKPGPGKNRYAWGLTKEKLDAFLKEYPQLEADIFDLRSLVRANTPDNIKKDLAALTKYPVLDTLHPLLKEKLEQAKNNPQQRLYAVPYSVAYADDIMKAYELLQKASRTIASTDKDFADYLANRSRDFLSDDYESGDASWVTGSFGNLNAQIGSYETYDDALLGVKSAFSMSILIKDRERSAKLANSISDLQEIENSLPYEHHKKVRSDIPIGVYHVYADFGQARGTNTASILPNESRFARKYGRIILMRYNVLTNPTIVNSAKTIWKAVVAEPFANDLTGQSNYIRTMWHEIGHYMGPSLDKQGRTLDVAMQDNANLLEEMKSDLVSLHSAAFLHDKGVHDDATLRSVYAGGIMRTLQRVKPRRSQPYQTMQLMTFNFFREQGVISFDADSGLSIDYEKYPKAVTKLLAKLLDIQYQGDKQAADDFIKQYSHWDESVHGAIAKRISNTKQPRYRIVSYEALGE
jgi:hypothetical protein